MILMATRLLAEVVTIVNGVVDKGSGDVGAPRDGVGGGEDG